MQLFLNVTCNGCKHLIAENYEFTCKAFPKGIPDKILDGKHDHTKPFKGDNGILFEPIKESK